MALDAKYGVVLVERNAGNSLGDDEPVFVLRARDVTSVSALIDYRRHCEIHGAPARHIAAIDEAIKTFAAWRENNPALMKVPD